MLRRFYHVPALLREHPGNRALILQSPAGKTLVWLVNDPIPKGRYCLLGVIE